MPRRDGVLPLALFTGTIPARYSQMSWQVCISQPRQPSTTWKVSRYAGADRLFVAVHARPAPPHFSESDDRTVDALIEEKRHQALKDVPVTPPSESTTPAQALPDTAEKDETTLAAEALEEEAGQQGAFNPETGEINWDCPCLGGMAHGPCGEDFKAAFSCFVYSNEEPKGMECIDKFQYVLTSDY